MRSTPCENAPRGCSLDAYLKGLTVAQFDRMCASGIIPEGRHVELLAGGLDEVTKGEPHNYTVGVLSMLLRSLVPEGSHVREEKSASSSATMWILRTGKAHPLI